MATARTCPRDKKLLRSAVIGDASVEICGACAGTFFDAEDLLAAGGVFADPSTWDRAETGGAVKPGALACPGCESTMHAQDVTHDGKHVEVDRCGKCRGIWLDKGELDTLVVIGTALHPILERERARIRAELLALEQAGATDFSAAAKKKLRVGIAVAVAAVVGGCIYGYFATRPVPRTRYDPGPDLYERPTGCPCGCDRSAALAAELRRKADVDALATIEETLVTIGKREEAGYITERMVQHRLRMLDVAGEILARRPELPATFPELDRLAAGTPVSPSRCASPRIEAAGLRVCAELALHGERVEIVHGAEKLITSSFRLWLEIENLGAEPRTVGVPSIDVPAIRLPVARWYREGSAGRPFDGIVRPGERARVNVIGDIPDRVLPRSSFDATVHLDAVTVRVTTEARAVIHFAQR